jgi:PleD family two-component response regulator
MAWEAEDGRRSATPRRLGAALFVDRPHTWQYKASMADGNGRKVLIVDEDVMAVIEAETVLREANYLTAHLSTPAGFWAKLDYEKPDLLLIDIFMSLFNSNSVIEQLRTETAYEEVAIVIFSDRDADKLQEFCVDKDINGYFCKTQDITQLP